MLENYELPIGLKHNDNIFNKMGFKIKEFDINLEDKIEKNTFNLSLNSALLKEGTKQSNNKTKNQKNKSKKNKSRKN